MKKYILFYSTLFLFLAAFAFESLCNAAEANIELLQDRNDGVSFEVKLPLLQFEDTDGYKFKRVNANGFYTVRKSGAPGVIAKHVLIEVPYECDIDVQVHSLDRTRFESIFLAPSPTRILVEGEQGQERIAERFEIDKKAYLNFRPKRTAASEPVQAPVTGRGTATNNTKPIRSYLSITLPRRLVRSKSQRNILLKRPILLSNLEAALRNARIKGTGNRLPMIANRRA